MDKSQKIIVFAIAFAVIASIIFLFKTSILLNCCASEYQRFNSPDKEFTIIVYRYTQSFAFPGAAGDAPGVVQLVDKNDNIIQQKEVDMVQLIDRVDWQAQRVDIKLFASWSLLETTSKDW